MRALALVLLCLTAACMTQARYVAVIPLSNGDGFVLGTVRCDRNGHPYIEIDTTMDAERMRSVMVHENKHIAQIRAYGPCREFVSRYRVDSMFRLGVESDAYCSVVNAQRAAMVPTDPTPTEIIGILRMRYGSAYTLDAILNALPCG